LIYCRDVPDTAGRIVRGERPGARDSALTTASAEVKRINGFSPAATFEGEFSNVTTSCAGKGTAWKCF
jgi:hypothetical protein